MRPDPTSLERPILPLFSLVDVQDRLVLHRSGRLTLVYRITAFHEPALDDPEFEHLAEQLTHAWSALPERVSYQFLTLVDTAGVERVLHEVFRPVPEVSQRHQLYEAVRAGNLARFEAHTLALGDSAGRDLLQARQHFLAVSFLPRALARHGTARVPFLQHRDAERPRICRGRAFLRRNCKPRCAAQTASPACDRRGDWVDLQLVADGTANLREPLQTSSGGSIAASTGDSVFGARTKSAIQAGLGCTPGSMRT